MNIEWIVGGLFGLVIVQFGMIYALVNRIFVQAGLRRMQPKSVVDEIVERKPEPVVKPKVISGSQKVGI